MTHEEAAAWRAQIDLADDYGELVRIIKALRNIDPVLMLLLDQAEKKRLHMEVDGTVVYKDGIYPRPRKW